MIEIDGSQGEGGGQVLRSALALSIITGQAMRIYNIRLCRSKPGLMPQHLQSVDAASAVSRAHTEGAALGSLSLLFEPGEIRSGRYQFDIGTAGATTLVLQTVFLPLSMATAASSLIITGGTHVPAAPCFEFLDLHWLPYLRQAGFQAQLSLDQAGFYPQGGGRISATVRPAGPLTPLRLTERGRLERIYGISAVANLDLSIADRQKRRALQRLEGIHPGAKIKTIQYNSPGKGTVLLLVAEFDGGRCCTFSLGKLGKPAEQVADEAVAALQTFIETGAAIDEHMADQLLLPLSLAQGQSELFTSKITPHLLTNADIIRLFTSVRIEIDGETNEPGWVRICPEKSCT